MTPICSPSDSGSSVRRVIQPNRQVATAISIAISTGMSAGMSQSAIQSEGSQS
jgi:hypothetical protein